MNTLLELPCLLYNSRECLSLLTLKLNNRGLMVNKRKNMYDALPVCHKIMFR